MPPLRALPLVALTALALGVAPASPSRAQQRVDKEGQGAIIEGAEGLPDLARGKAAAAAGRLEDAERDLLPLAELGYVEAQLALGRLYTHMQSADADAKAIHWLRAAQPDTPLAEVPLARALVREGSAKSLAEAEQIFAHGWDEREDVDALAGLIELYAIHPQYDRQHRVETLVATAEKLGQPQATVAVIRWYRSTQEVEGHAERMRALCRKSLDLVPECHVELVRDARARGDGTAMEQLVAAALSQFGQDRVPFTVLAGIARALVATPKDDEPNAAPVAVSDVPEVDASELAPASNIGSASGAASAMRSCAEAPVGLATTTAAAPVAQAPAAAAAPMSAASAEANVPAASGTQAAPAAQAAVSSPSSASPGANAELANRIVAKLASGPAEARVQAAGVVVRYPYLAPHFDVEAALEEGRKQGVADATLFLGQLHLHGQRGTRDPQAALRYLEEAAKSPPTAVEAHYLLGRLYQYGYLDEVDPVKAQAQLLIAARQGYMPADGALARLYASGKGACTNRVYAYVFAELGARGGAGTTRMLRDRLRETLDAKERAAAGELLQQELAARSSSNRMPGLAQADTSGGHP